MIKREREVQRQRKNGKIAKTRYNKRYREIDLKGRIPSYLKVRNIANTSMGNEVKAMIKLRCGNLEHANKYWIDERQWACLFLVKEAVIFILSGREYNNYAL